MVLRQADRARVVYFLLAGSVQILLRVGEEGLLLAVLPCPGELLGWSAFRPPFRLINGLPRPRPSGVSGQPPRCSSRNGRHPQGGIEAYQRSRAKRCADRHFPRSPLSLRREVIRSNFASLWSWGTVVKLPPCSAGRFAERPGSWPLAGDAFVSRGPIQVHPNCSAQGRRQGTCRPARQGSAQGAVG